MPLVYNGSMKNKKSSIIPQVFRSLDSISIVLLGRSAGNVTITRRKVGPLNTRWSAKRKAVISWSGGGGSETIEAAKQFAVMLQWAARIARNLNVRNPDKATDRDLLYTNSN
jgi:hypothetical protein